MSLQATLSNALSGLNVTQHALSLTAHNIVNASTEGYARKIALPETQITANRGAGVRTGATERAVDQFLTQEIGRQANELGEAEAIERYHARLQDFLGRPGENADIAFKIGELETSFEALAANPENGALRVEVLTTAESLSGQINDFAAELQRLRADADQEIETLAVEINGELAQVAELNGEIVRLHNIGQSNPELLDRRDALIKSLSGKLDLSTFVREDGALVVQTGGGVPLVDETARVLLYEAAQQVGPGSSFGTLEVYHRSQIDQATGQPEPGASGIELISSGVRGSLSAELQNDAVADADQLITTRLRGGRIVGLLEIRDRLLPELNDQLQELAEGLRFAINEAHNDTTPVPPPNGLTGTRTDLSSFAGAARSGLATLAVVDRSDGSTLSAFQVDLGAAADETDVVAQLNAGLGALGTASIGADGALRIALADSSQGLAVAEGDSAITIQDAAGRERTYGMAHYFGLNDLLVQERSQASSLAVRPDLLRNPGLVGTGKLEVTTGPLTAALGGRGDNRGVLEMASALRSGHDVIARGGLPASTTSMGAYAASMIAVVSVEARNASDGAATQRAFADALEFRSAAISGVNVDEEMSRLVQLQKGYTVAARIISVTDEMFDELFRAAQ